MLDHHTMLHSSIEYKFNQRYLKMKLITHRGYMGKMTNQYKHPGGSSLNSDNALDKAEDEYLN
jgi:hypothetical protein